LQRFYDNKETFPKIKKQPLHSIPIKRSSPKIVHQITDRVEKIATAKGKDPSTDTSVLEREIDEHIYAIYDLTSEEIDIVKKATA
jgi:hypothetical protein